MYFLAIKLLCMSIANSVPNIIVKKHYLEVGMSVAITIVFKSIAYNNMKYYLQYIKNVTYNTLQKQVLYIL